MAINKGVGAISMTVICTIFIVYCCGKAFGDVPAEKLLMDHLLSPSRYNSLLRPKSDQVNVHFHMIISQLIGLDEREQYMTTKVSIPHKWQDSRLMWTPGKFSNIKKLQLPSTKIWLPDVVLYNNIDGQYEVSLSSNAIITYLGEVMWTPQAIYKSTCNLKVGRFPFDRQNCSMTFRSWTYTRRDLNLALSQNEADMTSMVPSGEWHVESAPAYRSDCCGDDDFQQLNYSLIMQRKPLFYIMNLIIPCILITVLAILVFYTPSDCGEKMTLCISVLLALTVFLLLLSKMIPPTSLEIPLIGKYLLFTMCLVTLSVIMSVIVLNLHHRTPYTHTMTPWIRRCFLEILPRYIMERPQPDMKPETQNKISMVGISGRRQPVAFGTETSVLSSSDMRDLLSWTGYVAGSTRKGDEFRQHSEDWKFVAMMVDRILFFVFTVSFVIGTIAIFQ